MPYPEGFTSGEVLRHTVAGRYLMGLDMSMRSVFNSDAFLACVCNPRVLTLVGAPTLKMCARRSRAPDDLGDKV